MKKIVLYTDNGCDLEKDVLEQYGIKQFYMPTIIKGVTYFDRLTISPTEFYHLLDESGVTPTTSQLNLANIQAEFEAVLQDPEAEIIYIAFSSGLSGTYQTACLARDMFEDGRITVIDSLNASLGYGMIVLQAARDIAAGKSKAEVIAGIEDMIKRMQTVVIVGNFEMLKRGGRVNVTTAMIGDLLNIKLIIHIVDGKLIPLEKAHGLKKAKKRLMEIVEQRGSDMQATTIGLVYSRDLEGAMELQMMMQEKWGSNQFMVAEIGALIGSHIGAGTLGVFFLAS